MVAMTESGCDIIEVGVPYSDPGMDGPVIATATEAAASTPATLHPARKDLRFTHQIFREFSNANLDSSGVFWEHFDVVDLLQVLMISTRVLVGTKPVKVELVAGQRPLTICSNGGTVLQIASNLLENAARHTDHGRITLILGIQQDHMTLMVTDTGKGMREADVKRITSRMNDCDGRRRPGRPAFGTGLSRTRSLVKLLGGDISLASRWNEGTIVEVRLPFCHGRELTAASCA